jgi:hypothetical protein
MVPFMALDNTVALFIAPCALREAHGRGESRHAWGGRCNAGFGFSRFATAFMNNPVQASGSTLIDPATNWLHREEGFDFFVTMASF